MDTEKKDIDLDKVRDEKCIPVARAILNDMAKQLIPEDANVKVDFNPIVTSVLTRQLEADTNIAMENPYIFQLILGVLAGLNKTVQLCATAPIDDIRFGRIATKILEIVAKGNIRMGTVTPEEIDADFAPLKEELNGLFAEEKLSMVEIKYVMDNIFTSFSSVQTLVGTNIEMSMARADAKLFGVEHMTDVTMKRLDEVLKK